MIDTIPKIYAEFAFILRDREDVRSLARALSKAFNPKFFTQDITDQSENVPETIVLSLLGSFYAFKSAVVDDVTDELLPQVSPDIPLSGYGHDYEELPFLKKGHSKALNDQLIELSFTDPTNQIINAERTIDPGIHFIQNVPVTDKTWLTIRLQTAAPRENPNFHDSVLNARAVVAKTATEQQKMDFLDSKGNVDVHIAEQTLELFDYIDEKTLSRHGLSKVFAQAASENETKPRLVTIQVHDERLMNDPYFQRFMAILKDIQNSPEHASFMLDRKSVV